MRNCLRNKKGFTLVEIIVTLVIAGICIAVAGGILISSTNLVANIQIKDKAKQVAVTAAAFLNEETKFAAEITPVPYSASVSLDPDDAVFYIGNEAGVPANRGYLFFRRVGDAADPVNIFGVNYYQNMKMSLDVSAVRNSANDTIVVTETISLFFNDNLIRTDVNTFALVNSLIYSDLEYVWTDIDVDGASWIGYFTVTPLA
ncbi:MAG: type II secretion system GspH family protein [Clostridiales Family XIII bacterium]|jgi:prepilin-type N-terminal cleavage/methylation domain-containing protein|nr:type II secretion system GspH family protein [Clostridiales Family XIII bacterium]